MSGIFPNAVDGGQSAATSPGGYTPAIPPSNTSLLYFGSNCTTVLRPEVLNSLIAEITCSVSEAGLSYNANSSCNLSAAMVAIANEAIAQFTTTLCDRVELCHANIDAGGALDGKYPNPTLSRGAVIGALGFMDCNDALLGLDAKIATCDNLSGYMALRSFRSPLYLTVNPEALASEVDGVYTFRTVADARAAIALIPGLGPKRQVHVTLLPGNYTGQRVIGIPWVEWGGLGVSSPAFEDSSALGGIVLSNAMTVERLHFDGRGVAADWVVVGDSVRGFYINIDILSAGVDAVSQGIRRGRALKLTGAVQTGFMDGIVDLDHATADPGFLLDLDGTIDNDFHFGFRNRAFFDGLHMQNGALIKINRGRGINFWNVTARTCGELNPTTGGFNTTPLEMTNLLPDGVTLAPGECNAIIEGGAFSGAPLRIGERCKLLISGGATIPGVTATSRGDLVVVSGETRAVTRPGAGRFTWANQLTASLDVTATERTAGIINLVSGPGRVVPDLSIFTELKPAGANHRILSTFEVTSPTFRNGNKAGIVLNDGTGKAIFFGIDGFGNLIIETFATLSSAPTLLFATPWKGMKANLQIQQIGATRFFDASSGTAQVAFMFSHAANTFLTTTRVGFGIDSANFVAGAYPVSMAITDYLNIPLP